MNKRSEPQYLLKMADGSKSFKVASGLGASVEPGTGNIKNKNFWEYWGVN